MRIITEKKTVANAALRTRNFLGLTLASPDCDPFKSGMSDFGKVFTRNDMLRHHFSKHTFLRGIKRFKVGELVKIFLATDFISDIILL